MTQIHPSSIVHPNAQLGENVEIGPFCIVGEHVKIGDGTKLLSHVVVENRTIIGKNNTIFPSAVIGAIPQDLKYRGEDTEVIIGDGNTIRECVTINLSTSYEEPTTVGNGCLLMAYVHLGHNCMIGNNVILANAVNLAGHIIIDDYAILGGMTAVHQFVKIGKHAFVGGKSAVKKDVPPYTRGEGMPYLLSGLNSVGLSRKGFSDEQISGLKKIYRHFYRKKLNVSQALDSLPEDLSNEAQEFVDFVKNAERGITK
jgi:UDP-N-acetylglucosamine acyltransferase